jgi:hypothetical protein
MRHPHWGRFGALLVATLVAATPLFAQQPPARPASFHGIDPGNIDRAVNPGIDFYKFADGGWLAANPVPPQYSRWGSFNELADKNERDLHTILEEAAANTNGNRTPSGATTRISRLFWSLVLSTITVSPTLGRSSAVTLCMSAHCSLWAPGGVSQRICQSPCTERTAPWATAGPQAQTVASSTAVPAASTVAIGRIRRPPSKIGMIAFP